MDKILKEATLTQDFRQKLELPKYGATCPVCDILMTVTSRGSFEPPYRRCGGVILTVKWTVSRLAKEPSLLGYL